MHNISFLPQIVAFVSFLFFCEQQLQIVKAEQQNIEEHLLKDFSTATSKVIRHTRNGCASFQSILRQTWQSPRLCCYRCSPAGFEWRQPDRKAAASSPALSHPPREASWKCRGLWGPAPAAARRQEDKIWTFHIKKKETKTRIIHFIFTDKWLTLYT